MRNNGKSAVKEQPSVREGKVVYLSPEVLLTHPKNMRRVYPPNDVQEMAASISKRKGVIHALQIVKSPTHGKYYVVDGNVRLAGARALGKDSPLLKCEITNQSTAEQLLDMVITAKVRHSPDAISEGSHYKRLMKEEGYSVEAIADHCGIHRRTIDGRLKLLKLEPEIQELVANRDLPADMRATDALLSISDPKARIKMAQRLAKDGASIKAIVIACEKLVERLGRRVPDASEGRSVRMARGRAFGKEISPGTRMPLKEVRKAAKEVCAKCDLRLRTAGEPAWSLVSHTADETCGACELKDLGGSCGQCPTVDLLRRLINTLGVSRHA